MTHLRSHDARARPAGVLGDRAGRLRAAGTSPPLVGALGAIGARRPEAARASTRPSAQPSSRCSGRGCATATTRVVGAGRGCGRAGAHPVPLARRPGAGGRAGRRRGRARAARRGGARRRRDLGRGAGHLRRLLPAQARGLSVPERRALLARGCARSRAAAGRAARRADRRPDLRRGSARWCSTRGRPGSRSRSSPCCSGRRSSWSSSVPHWWPPRCCGRSDDVDPGRVPKYQFWPEQGAGTGRRGLPADALAAPVPAGSLPGRRLPVPAGRC